MVALLRTCPLPGSPLRRSRKGGGSQRATASPQSLSFFQERECHFCRNPRENSWSRTSLFLSVPLAVAKATGVYPATFRERVVPAEKPANPLFLCCAPGRSQGGSGAVRWSGGLSRRPNGSRTVRPPSRWRVPQTANPGRLPCQGPPYLAVARQRPQTDTDISNK